MLATDVEVAVEHRMQIQLVTLLEVKSPGGARGARTHFSFRRGLGFEGVSCFCQINSRMILFIFNLLSIPSFYAQELNILELDSSRILYAMSRR